MAALGPRSLKIESLANPRCGKVASRALLAPIFRIFWRLERHRKSRFFGGHLDFVQQVKTVVALPILRKDFIISKYQVWESFHAGADAILLIADAIDFSLLSALYHLASELGIHVLIETHSLEHLDNIASLNPQIVGINCRNLQTMETDLSWFESVYSKLPADCVKVAESGIKTNDDLNNISHLGYDAVLVGTSLMKTGAPGTALATLLQRVPA